MVFIPEVEYFGVTNAILIRHQILDAMDSHFFKYEVLGFFGEDSTILAYYIINIVYNCGLGDCLQGCTPRFSSKEYHNINEMSNLLYI